MFQSPDTCSWCQLVRLISCSVKRREEGSQRVLRAGRVGVGEKEWEHFTWNKYTFLNLEEQPRDRTVWRCSQHMVRTEEEQRTNGLHEL